MRRTKYIETKNQLIAEVEKTLKPVLDRVGERLLEDLQEQIENDVYFYDYFPNMRYHGVNSWDEEYGFAQPTFDFLEAWKVVSSKLQKNSLIEIKYDAKNMSTKAHKSIVTKKNMKWQLNKILNVDGYTSGLMVGSIGNEEMGIKPTIRNVSKLRKPYWNNFIKKIKSKSLISKYMKQEAKKLGVNLV